MLFQRAGGILRGWADRRDVEERTDRIILLVNVQKLAIVPRRVDDDGAVAAMADDLATYPDWPIGEFVPHSEATSFWIGRYPPF